jgi:hypothetical protein
MLGAGRRAAGLRPPIDFRQNGCIVASFSCRELRNANGATMADYRRAICALLILLALLGVAGCCPPWTEPPFVSAYSAVGAQVK